MKKSNCNYFSRAGSELNVLITCKTVRVVLLWAELKSIPSTIRDSTFNRSGCVRPVIGTSSCGSHIPEGVFLQFLKMCCNGFFSWIWLQTRSLLNGRNYFGVALAWSSYVERNQIGTAWHAFGDFHYVDLGVRPPQIPGFGSSNDIVASADGIPTREHGEAML